MSRKVFAITLMLTLVLGVGIAQAQIKWVQVEDYGWVTAYTDGRLNAFDIDAPMMIYETYEPTVMLDEQGNMMFDEHGGGLLYEDVLTGIEIWHYDGELDSSQKVLRVEAADLEAMIEAGEGRIEADGFSLNYTPSGWMWVDCPPDADGNVYAFQWEFAGL